MQKDSRTDIGRFSDLDQKKSHTYKPNGKWDRVAEDVMLNVSESAHPVFRASSALERGDLKKQNKKQKEKENGDHGDANRVVDNEQHASDQ